MSNVTPIKVFVHLARGQDAEEWRQSHASGKLVGLNDETPYGYGRAVKMGCEVEFSRKGEISVISKLFRFVAYFVLKFDFVHAWKQRHAMKRADIIWTHTESQFLSVAAVLLLTKARTRLLGQSVWLIDRWPQLPHFHRRLYRRLIRRVDVMTFLSPANQQIAAKLFPESDVRIVPFGIPSEQTTPPRLFTHGPVRVLAAGNDRHRDWATLIEAVRGAEDIELQILSGTAPAHLAKSCPNVSVRSAKSNDEMLEALRWADLACVPLKTNLHASGITAIQEAILSGVPVVATDVGGLDLYFPHDEVHYVPPHDPISLRGALRSLSNDAKSAQTRAIAAQTRMTNRETHGAHAYVTRHVEISRELLGL